MSLGKKVKFLSWQYVFIFQRSTSLHGVDQVPRITAIQRPKSNSWADLSPNGPNGHGVSNGHLTLPNRSSKVRLEGVRGYHLLHKT